MSISERAYDISFKKKKIGGKPLREEKQLQQAKLKACNVITVDQTRLILIWFLNPCVIKTAQREQHQGVGGKKDISQMLRPSARVTRKVILRFKRTNLRLVGALTLQGKRKSYFCLSPNFKYGIHLPYQELRCQKSASKYHPLGLWDGKTVSDLSITGAEKYLFMRPSHINTTADMVLTLRHPPLKTGH